MGFIKSSLIVSLWILVEKGEAHDTGVQGSLSGLWVAADLIESIPRILDREFFSFGRF